MASSNTVYHCQAKSEDRQTHNFQSDRFTLSLKGWCLEPGTYQHRPFTVHSVQSKA